MTRPKPEWHNVAARMRAAGATIPAIQAAVGKSETAVRHALYPHEAERGVRCHMAWAEKNPEKRRVGRKRAGIRRAAREEAAATGEPLEAVYARWGVTSIKPGVWP